MAKQELLGEVKKLIAIGKEKGFVGAERRQVDLRVRVSMAHPQAICFWGHRFLTGIGLPGRWGGVNASK